MMATIARTFRRWLNGAPGHSAAPARPIRARYDAATPDRHNEQHFSMADSLSAREANSPAVRERLRNYARYEVANNSYARGMLNTLADVEIGTGAMLYLPRPVDSTAEIDDGLKDAEHAFKAWAEEVDLWAKLWTARIAKAQDGEAVGVFRVNENLDHPIPLDLQLIEAEQLSHGWEQDTFQPGHVDGVEADGFGNVLRYFVLPEHPGDATTTQAAEPIAMQPAQVVHWLRLDRPGQLRGIPEVTPALPLFAQLRRFTLASLTAAEHAADIAAVIKTTHELGEITTAVSAFDTIEMERGMFMELPEGRDIGQIKQEHPGPQYAEFKRELLCEIARALQLPKSMALGDSSDYNYASGRLDRQAFDKHVEVSRRHCERQVLRKVWVAWWEFAKRQGLFSDSVVMTVDSMRPKWIWRHLGHVDRAKEEQGRQLALSNQATNEILELGREGIHPEEHYEQLAYIQRRREAYGLNEQPAPPEGNTNEGENDADEVATDSSRG